MRVLRFAVLLVLIALVPSTSGAPVDPIDARAPAELWADGLGALRGIAVGSDGAVYVADRDAGTVTRLGADGSRTIVADTLDCPVGIAFDATGRLLVAEERAGRVVRVESGGTRTVLLEAQQPRWLAVAPDGTLYVAARAATRSSDPPPDDESQTPQVILQLTPALQLTTWASGFTGLQGLAADDHAVYLAAQSAPGSSAPGLYTIDRGSDGSAGGVTLVAGGLSQPMGVALDPLHEMVAADLALRTLTRATADGTTTVASRFTGPTGVASDASGNLFIADGDAGRVVKLRAPAAPVFGALPAYTKESPLTVSLTAEAGAAAYVVANDQSVATAIATGTGAATVSVPLAGNAVNTLMAWAVGAGGAGLASVPVEITLTHDNVAPAITLQSPAGPYAGASATVQAQVSDGGSGVASVTITLDGAPLAVTPTPTLPTGTTTASASWSGVAEGVHTLAVSAADRAGNAQTLTRTLTVDTTPPTTRITGGPTQLALGTIGTFTFTGDDNLTPTPQLQFAWRMDAGPWSAYATVTSAVFSSLALGAHRFDVRARDLAGNEDPRPARRVFTVAAGSSSDAQSTGDFTLTLKPASVPILPGSTTTLGITASDVRNPRNTVALSITGLPTGVTALLVPPRLAPGQLGQIVLRAAADAPASTQPFTVSAMVETLQGPHAASVIGSVTVIAGNRTALIGRVVETDRTPLAGVAIVLDQLTAYTDANGNFLMLDPPPGEQVVLIDGDPISVPGRRYPTIPLTLTIVADGVNELPYLPHLHRQHERFTAIHPTNKTIATDSDHPGVKLHLEGDNKVMGWDGREGDRVSIRTVPADRLPLRPLPPSVNASKVYMFYFGKRGGGVPRRPVPFEAPNELGLKPGEKATLWFYDESPRKGEAPNDWRVAGTGTVSDDGLTIKTDPGVGIPKFCCGSTAFGSWQRDDKSPSATAEPGKVISGGSDPVDLSTGIFMLNATDLVIPGRIPLAIKRSYRSGDPDMGPFGTGTIFSDYQEALQLTSETIFTYVYANGTRSQFVQQPNGTYTNTTVPAFRGVTITSNADSTRTLRFRDGRTITFTTLFQGTGAPTSIRDANGNTITIARDNLTNPVTITDGAGRALTITWGGADAPIARVTDPLGRTVSYAYDVAGNLISVTNPAGGVTQYTYDSRHRMTAIRDARGITFLTNTYDVNSRVCQQTQVDGGVFTMYYVTADIATSPASVQLLNEAASGGPISQAPCGSDASSGRVVATVQVDPRGNTTTYRFSSAGDLTSVTDALGHTTTYTRDPATNFVTSVTDALSRTTALTYDAAGNVLTVTDPANQVRTFTYETTFNKVTSVKDPLNHTTSFTYDTKGNLTRVTDALNNQTTIAYDSGGRPISVTDPLNHTTTFTYDAAGNLLTAADALGNTTARAYDAVSRLLNQTNPLGLTTTLTYDPLNHVTTTHGPANDFTRFTYDANGNLLSLTDPLNRTTIYTYDSMDHVATRTDPLGRSESFTYDAAGNLASHTDRKNQVATFAYDVLNRRSGAMFPDATTTYAYDAAGRLTQASDSVGGTISNTYDVLNRITSHIQPTDTVSYTYDASGRRTTMTVPDLAPIVYGYDNVNRLTSIAQGPNVVQFTYDAANRRTSLTLPNGVSTMYNYDIANLLASITYKLGTTTLGDLQYAYDAAGQRIAISGSWARTGLPAALSNATYNVNNQQTSFGGQTLTYDLNGNLTGDGTNTFAWDSRNRLTGISGGPVSAGYVYDAFGRRRSKAINSVWTHFLFDRLNPVQEQMSSGTTSLLTGLETDEYFTRTDAAGMVGFLRDHVGSIVELVDGGGTVQTSYTYDPFGTSTVSGAMSTNPFDYTARESDATPFRYYRARYYDSTRQRFSSEDPIGFNAGDVNLYAYVRNNPLGFIDLLGLDRASASPTPPVALAGFSINQPPTIGLPPPTSNADRNARLAAAAALAAGGAILLDIGGHLTVEGLMIMGGGLATGNVPLTIAGGAVVGVGVAADVVGFGSVLLSVGMVNNAFSGASTPPSSIPQPLPAGSGAGP
jgi:RHS repeat-associated protein